MWHFRYDIWHFPSSSPVYRAHSGVRTQIHDLFPKPHNRLRCSPYWSLYSCVTLTVGRQLTGDATRRCGRAPDSSLSTVLIRAVSSFWLCEVPHFPGPAFSSPCDLFLHFPSIANSRGEISSVIFQVLQIPGLRFGPSFSRCCNFQSLFFCGPTFSGPANSAPPSSLQFLDVCCSFQCIFRLFCFPQVV